jgi:hypothetical protein
MVAHQPQCINFVQQYFQNLYRINNQEIPNLPPFEVLQNFCEDKFIDIILYGTTGSWAREMEWQGFDPMDHTAKEVVVGLGNTKNLTK